jgi:hypothetical protein
VLGWGIGGGVGGELCGQGSAYLFLLPLLETGPVYRKWNKVKRIIVPTGYSNELWAA